MANDIRLVCGFSDHPKTIKLVRRCGEKSFRCLIRLWCWARDNKPDGKLAGMPDEDIEIAAGWDGEPGQFIQTLRDVLFLDGSDLHDWEKHQGWACGQTQRSEHARKAAKAKWDKKMLGQCSGIAGAEGEQCSGDAPSPNPLPSPLPLPSPPPSPKKKEPFAHADAFAAFWMEYPRKVGKEKTIKAWKKVSPSAHVKIMEALTVQSASWAERGEPEFIPYPASWLNQKRWEDETAPSSGKTYLEQLMAGDA